VTRFAALETALCLIEQDMTGVTIMGDKVLVEGREQVQEHRRRFPQEWTQAWNVVEGTLRAVLYVWRRPFYPRARGRLFRMGLRTAARG
jgi:hypothetical protein